MTGPPALKYEKLIPILPAKDVDKTIDFWCALGWKVGGKHPGFASIFTGEGSHTVNLYYREETTLGKGEVIVLMDIGHARLFYDHLQQIAASLPAHVELRYAPDGGERCEPKPWGFEQFSVLDPDGHKITFAAHLTDDEDEPEVQAPGTVEA